MKKSKTIIGKILITILVLIMIFGFMGGNTPYLSASSDVGFLNSNSHLVFENMELRKKYSDLEKRVKEMEETAKRINEYDNVLYSQILGVDFDTTDFIEYRNDSINFMLEEHDSIFIMLDERALYAAEMLSTQLTKIQETSTLFKKNKNAIKYYPNISPIKTSEFIYISSPYGWRMHPIDKVEIFHDGIDISATVGSEVYSTAQGRVVKIMYSKYGYGNRVVIEHAYGFETLYAHMHTLKVKKGQWVQKGQLIGTVGNSGKSTGPHLHYEIHKNGETRDPLGYFYSHMTDELLAME